MTGPSSRINPSSSSAVCSPASRSSRRTTVRWVSASSLGTSPSPRAAEPPGGPESGAAAVNTQSGRISAGQKGAGRTGCGQMSVGVELQIPSATATWTATAAAAVWGPHGGPMRANL
eukprot:6305911-Pyramimonas_sp.AAC.1